MECILLDPSFFAEYRGYRSTCQPASRMAFTASRVERAGTAHSPPALCSRRPPAPCRPGEGDLPGTGLTAAGGVCRVDMAEGIGVLPDGVAEAALAQLHVVDVIQDLQAGESRSGVPAPPPSACPAENYRGGLWRCSAVPDRG